MKIVSRKAQKYLGFDIRFVRILTLRIIAIRLGWWVVQFNFGDLPGDIKIQIHESIRAVKDGRVKSLEEVKKELNIK